MLMYLLGESIHALESFVSHATNFVDLYSQCVAAISCDRTEPSRPLHSSAIVRLQLVDGLEYFRLSEWRASGEVPPELRTRLD